ncbi:hypothetical protein Tco_1037542, partial [Tanacetum coccineum]
MTTTNNNNNNSQMHNHIMAAGSKDRTPMLATGSYAQWQLRFMRYVNTKPNIKELKKCIFNGPYNTLPETCAYIDAKAEAIHMILSGIGDEISSKVDACKTTQEMWTTIERLQQGESLNKQDVKTNLFWEFCKFTSREWSRFVTIVKQTIDLDKESYHKLFDILKQYQNKVNEIRAKKIVRNENPLALVTAAQQYPNDNYYHAPKPYKNQTTSSRHTSPTSSHAPTKTKSKEVAKPRKPSSLSALEDVSDPEQ